MKARIAHRHIATYATYFLAHGRVPYAIVQIMPAPHAAC